MSALNSTEYGHRTTLGVLAAAKEHGSHPRVFPFEVTLPAVAPTNPTLNLTTVPAGFRPELLVFQNEALSSSAGVGLTVDVGDSGDADRLAAAIDADAANAFVGLRIATTLGFVYSADTDIVATVTGTATASAKIKGYLMGVMDDS